MRKHEDGPLSRRSVLGGALLGALAIGAGACTSSSSGGGKPGAGTVPGRAEVNCDDPKYRDPASKDPLAEQCARSNDVKAKGHQVHYAKKFDLSGLPEYRPQQQVSGVIRQVGSNYLADSPVAAQWEAAFREHQPGVTFHDQLTSSFIGMAALTLDTADMAPMGREATWDELSGYQRQHNCAPLQVIMSTGSFDVAGWTPALGVFVHDANPLRQLNFDQLDGIFGAARTGGWNGLRWNADAARGPEKNIRTWGQLGLTGDWAGKPINVYGFTPEFHYGDFFAKKVMRGSLQWNENIKEYVNHPRPDGTLAVATDLMIRDLAKDPYGISYSSLTPGGVPGTRPLALSKSPTGPFVDLTIDTVQNRSYPLTRNTYYYLSKPPGRPLDPAVREFMRFILSRDGQQIIMADGKYLPLTPAVAAKQLKKLG